MLHQYMAYVIQVHGMKMVSVSVPKENTYLIVWLQDDTHHRIALGLCTWKRL